MTDAGLRFVAMALAIGLGAIGPGAGIGVVFSGAFQVFVFRVFQQPADCGSVFLVADVHAFLE